MKRRNAIQNLAVLTTGSLILGGCDLGGPLPVYSNIPLEKKDRLFLDKIIDAILPQAEKPLKTPETTSHFVLTVVNDC